MSIAVRLIIGLTVAGFAVAYTTVNHSDSKVWIEEHADYTLPDDDVTTMVVTTRNGAIDVTTDPAADRITVHAHIKAGGEDDADAKACREALNVDLGQSGDRATFAIEWTTKRQKYWNASVAVDIVLPVNLDVEITSRNGAVTVDGQISACSVATRNGPIDVKSPAGPCDLTTRNGRVTLVGGSETVTIATRNGEVSVETSASRLEVVTRNGPVHARALAKGALSGSIATRNGDVHLALSKSADVKVQARTDRGRIKDRAGLQSSVRGDKTLTGTLGTGATELTISTRNGPIELTTAD
jgi:hypothetical protein